MRALWYISSHSQPPPIRHTSSNKRWTKIYHTRSTEYQPSGTTRIIHIATSLPPSYIEIDANIRVIAAMVKFITVVYGYTFWEEIVVDIICKSWMILCKIIPGRFVVDNLLIEESETRAFIKDPPLNNIAYDVAAIFRLILDLVICLYTKYFEEGTGTWSLPPTIDS